jgi:hypothetical protein
MKPEESGGPFGTTRDLRNDYVVSIEFTDANGNRWQRDPHGGLNPLDPPPPAAPSRPHRTGPVIHEPIGVAAAIMRGRDPDLPGQAKAS